jgi:serine protease Do
VSQVESKKTTDVAVLVFDEERKTVARSVFQYPEKKTYRLAYGVDKRDTRLASINAESDAEEAIERFENGELEVRLEEVYERLLSRTPHFEKYRERTALFTGSPQATKKPPTRTQAPSDDPRFESVVVVKNPNGAIGSGFFVEPTLVLTNYHVVEGSSMAEIRLRTGIEGVGKVIRTDPGLDLALIRV